MAKKAKKRTKVTKSKKKVKVQKSLKRSKTLFQQAKELFTGIGRTLPATAKALPKHYRDYLDAAEQALNNISYYSGGSGGLNVLSNGKYSFKSFSSKEEGLKLIKDIREGHGQA